MKYISLFSGIEAATVAWQPLGFQAVAFSEIDKFPSAVLAHHYPDVPNVGDITKFDWSKYHGAADIVIGGSPCQSFSIAGLRKGLDDERGQLMFAYLAAVAEIRPRWLVWENVRDVLSSGNGRDFGSFLGGLAKLGYGFAYRVFDAQYFRLAQRRRRVFVVGYLGNWRPPGAVLFEPESMRRNSPPAREESSEELDIIPILEVGARTGKSITDPRAGCGIGESNAPMFTLQAGKQHAVAFDCKASAEFMAKPGVIAPPLRSMNSAKGHDNGGGQIAVAVNLRGRESGSLPELSDLASIRAASGGSSRSYVSQCMAIRRLTPRECERLQGFPDDFTLIQYNGKPAKDGPRYKALGNSMAVPVVRWIGERISAVDEIMRRK